MKVNIYSTNATCDEILPIDCVNDGRAVPADEGIVLGLIFLKYISDAFDERRAQLRVAFLDEASDLHLPDSSDQLQRSKSALIAVADEALALAKEPGVVAQKLDRITSRFGELERRQVRKLPRLIAEIAIERTAHYEALENGTAKVG